MFALIFSNTEATVGFGFGGLVDLLGTNVVLKAATVGSGPGGTLYVAFECEAAVLVAGHCTEVVDAVGCELAEALVAPLLAPSGSYMKKMINSHSCFVNNTYFLNNTHLIEFAIRVNRILAPP